MCACIDPAKPPLAVFGATPYGLRGRRGGDESGLKAGCRARVVSDGFIKKLLPKLSEGVSGIQTPNGSESFLVYLVEMSRHRICLSSRRETTRKSGSCSRLTECCLFTRPRRVRQSIWTKMLIKDTVRHLPPVLIAIHRAWPLHSPELNFSSWGALTKISSYCLSAHSCPARATTHYVFQTFPDRRRHGDQRKIMCLPFLSSQ